MKRTVNIFEVLPVNVCVNLSCGNVGVAEHFLYSAQVRPPFQQVGRERMTERVWMDLFLEASHRRILFHHIADGRTRQRPTPKIQEQDIAGCSRLCEMNSAVSLV